MKLAQDGAKCTADDKQRSHLNIQDDDCPYCTGKSPLTDKLFEDGSRFDDMRSIRIQHFGKFPILVAQVRKRYFDCFHSLTEDQKKSLAIGNCFGVIISYCPICGRKLIKDEEEA